MACHISTIKKQRGTVQRIHETKNLELCIRVQSKITIGKISQCMCMTCQIIHTSIIQNTQKLYRYQNKYEEMQKFK